MKHRLAAILTAGILALLPLPAEANAADTSLVKSEISYTESTETINNPGMGYTSTLWYRCKPGNTPVHNPTGSLVLMFVDIGAFSCGENGTKSDDGTYTPGTDYEFDDAFFAGLRGTLENCRKNGCTVALRFRYDDDGTQNPEPATFDFLKHHIQQIDENGFLRDYQDILMYVESGFVGCYGEQWGGKYCSLEQKAELLDLLLDVVPDPIPVTVRTPNIFAKWAGIEQDALADWVSEPGSRASRVGLYDDGYMGSDSDLGTYRNREAETAWLGRQTASSYFGGEFSGNLEFAQKYETYLPQNAIPEMYRTHLSYINSNIWKLYQDYTFSADYDVKEGDHSAYYGQNVQKFMRDHLGYRFVLRGVRHTPEVQQGGQLALEFDVENTGFAAPVRAQKAELLLEKGGVYIRTPVQLDSRDWRSCQTVTEKLSVQLPGSLEPGDWNICLKLSVGDNTVPELALRSVQFANDGVWDASLGANRVGTVKIAAASDPVSRTVNRFGETDFPQYYTVSGLHILDGVISGEAEYGAPAAENDTGKLYLSSDEQYFYVAAEFPDAGDAPVFNVQLKNPDNGESYWIYFASNGYIYFNHDSYDGCIQKHSAHAFELRVPLGDVMGLKTGITLPSVRFSLQDSAHEWGVLSDIRSEEYTLTGGFPVYTAPVSLTVLSGTDVPLHVLTGAEQPAYQWYCGSNPLADAKADTVTVRSDVPGEPVSYAVSVRSAAGTELLIPAAEITVLASLIGDVDASGTVDALDVLLLRDHLLGKRQIKAENWRSGDMNGDGRLDVRDLTVLKRVFLK